MTYRYVTIGRYLYDLPVCDYKEVGIYMTYRYVTIRRWVFI